jgi:hypothetical protein
MRGFTIDRPDGRDGGDHWTEAYEELPGGANSTFVTDWLE